MDRIDKAQVRDINKKIKKGVRGNERSKRHEKVQNILLDELKGIRSIASISRSEKRKFSSRISETKLETSRQRGKALPPYSRNFKKIYTEVRAMKRIREGPRSKT